MILDKEKLIEKKEVLTDVVKEYLPVHEDFFKKFSSFTKNIIQKGCVSEQKEIEHWYDCALAVDSTAYNLHKTLCMSESIDILVKNYDSDDKSKMERELMDIRDKMVSDVNKSKANRIESFMEMKEAHYRTQREPNANSFQNLVEWRLKYSENNIKYAKFLGYYDGISYCLGLIDDLQSI